MVRLSRFRRPLLATLLIAIAGSAACSSPQTTFEPRSDAADGIQSLYIFVIIAASIVGAAVLAAMVYIMVRFRARPGHKAQQIHGNTTLEIVWTIAPIVVLVAITVPTVLGVVNAARDPEPDALRINVTAHQWWWEYEYEGLGPDGGPLVTANELRVPVGRQVAITLESDDVIHSFWVPQLVGKTDAIPGNVNVLEPFTPNEVGMFWGQCAEFCGSAHALMRFRVHVDSLADFQRWVTVLNTPPEQPTGLAATGAGLFIEAGCTVCHTISGTAALGKVGPDLSRLGARTTIGAGIVDNNVENLRDWIFDLREFKPVGEMVPGELRLMPSFGVDPPEGFKRLSNDEAAAIAAYLNGMTIE